MALGSRLTSNPMDAYKLTTNFVTRTPTTAPAQQSPTQMVDSFKAKNLPALQSRPAQERNTGQVNLGQASMSPTSVAVSASRVGESISASNSRLRTLALAAQQKKAQESQQDASAGGGGGGAYKYSGPSGSMVDKSVPPQGFGSVGNGKVLRADAAVNFNRMAAAFKAGTGSTLGVTAGYRSNARQAQLYALYKAGKGNLAAPPGKSLHQKGTAVDINGYGGGTRTKQFRWLLQNAHKFGFSWDNGRRYGEPWHWEFVG